MNTITLIPRGELQPNRWNRKHFNTEALGELAASIATQGIVQPLVVRELPKVDGVKMKFPRYEIVAGERRWRAAELAKVEDLPCLVRALDDRAARELCAIENLQREDLSAIEEARSYKELLDECDCKVEDLESRLGRKRSTIYARIRLLTLPPAVVEAIGAGEIDASVGDLIATIPAAKQREAALKEILDNAEWDSESGKQVKVPMPYRRAKELVERKFRKSLKDAPFDLKADKLAGEVSCAECPLRTGNIPGLPHGSNPHFCTAPACYARKVAAHQDTLLAALKAKGKTVLEGKDAPKWSYGSLAHDSGYVDAGGHHWVNEKNQPYTKLLGKNMPPLLHAVNPDGEVVAVVRRKELEAAMVAAKIIKPRESAEREKPETPEAKAKRELDEQIETLTTQRLVAAVLRPIEQGKGLLGVVRFLIDQCDNADCINHEMLCRRRQWANIIEPAKKLPAFELLGLLVEAFLAEAYAEEYIDRNITELAKHLDLKLDRKAIEKQVRAELAEQEKKEQAAPRAPKAKPAAKRKTKAKK